MKIKDVLSNTPVLAYFDVDKPITVTADASKNGLGAALLQDDKPIAYASRSLSKAEQRYAMIEKETLAIVFAMERFHQYVYDQPVRVETDHKPLVAIQHKPFNNCPARSKDFYCAYKTTIMRSTTKRARIRYFRILCLEQ
ncbi:hypothetical protein RRG08_005163 [Elysia crispata]|uniref:Reverse transcriptase RNase H-like domain-containing protein n=1 Tax=Elysia crispata TaxID=231223 RepID=A0AAE1DG23_9GAST|nr:hypothetical protein RRG08_005163 [Elysia crispata]